MATGAAVAAGVLDFSTASNTVDLEVSGFGAPDAAIIFCTLANTTNNPQNAASISAGFWTASSQCGIGVRSDHNVGTTETARVSSTSQVVLLPNPVSGTSGDTLLRSATASSRPDGIRLTVNDASGVLSMYCYAILIKGCTNEYIGTVKLNGTSATDITAPGFQPDAVFFLTIGVGSTNVFNSLAFSFGVATPTAQGSLQFVSGDNQTASSASTLVSDSYCIGTINASGTDWGAAAGSFDASGFSLTPTVDPANDIVYYLALKMADPDDIWVRIIDTKTGATGTQSYGTTSFTPQVAAFVGGLCTATDSHTTLGSFFFGATDGTTSRAFAYRDERNADPTDTDNEASLTDVVFIRNDNDGSDETVAALDSFSGTGFTLDYSDTSSTARKMLAFAIGDSTAGGSAPTLSDLQAVSITASSVQGTYDYAF